jgi:hypothetical protein
MKISLYTDEISNSISTKSALDWEATIITILLIDAQVEDSGHRILQERHRILQKKTEIARTWAQYSGRKSSENFQP